jgi:hypothetical protein
MLSVVDLIEAGTMSRDLAAYCLAAVGGGASFLVGAMPGGAGKTTVMGALLNFVPRDVELVPADSLAAIQRGPKAPSPRRCFICHEIGQGSYYAYLWGSELRAYLDLPRAGHMLATNLHADTFEQACEQICRRNRVPEQTLWGMNLMLFMSLRRSGLRVVRRIDQVWESDGSGPHRRVFDADSHSPDIGPTGLVSAEGIAKARQTVERLLTSKARTIEDVRAMILAEGTPLP